MNQLSLLGPKRSAPKPRWPQVSLLVIVSLVSMLPPTGAAEPSGLYDPERRDASFGLDLVTELEAPRNQAYGLGGAGVLDIEINDTDATSEEPVISLGLSSKLDLRTLHLSTRPLEIERIMPGAFPKLGDDGFSKSRWGVRWRLSLLESADRDGKL